MIKINIVSVIFILVGSFFCYARWRGFYAIYISKKEYDNFSMVGFVGGIFICIGLFLLKPTHSNISSYWWIGILVDSSLSWEWIILGTKKLYRFFGKDLD